MTSPFRVLIVDDDDTLREFMSFSVQDALKRRGVKHTIGEASGYDTGLAYIAGNNPHLTISDFNMVGKDGVEMIADARKRGYQGMAVIASGNADQAMDKAKELGLEIKVIAKPFKSATIKEIVDEALTKYQQ